MLPPPKKTLDNMSEEVEMRICLSFLPSERKYQGAMNQSPQKTEAITLTRYIFSIITKKGNSGFYKIK